MRNKLKFLDPDVENAANEALSAYYEHANAVDVIDLTVIFTKYAKERAGANGVAEVDVYNRMRAIQAAH